MNKRGFTLIELVAVILVIGVVAVITVPIVKDSIDNAKEKTLKKQTSSIIEGAKSWAIKNTDKLLDDGNSVLVRIATLKQEGYLENKTIADPVNKVEMNGCVDIKYNASYNQYEYEYKSSCKAANPVFTKATGSTNIPACITNNTPCNVSAAGDDGIKVGVKVNDATTYDFYVTSEYTNGGTITLIMNQNLGETVAWVSEDDYISAGGTEADFSSYGNNNKGPLTAVNYLESQTSSWTNIPSKTYTLVDDNEKYPSMIRTNARARMILYSEAAVLGCEDLASSTCPAWLYENAGSSYGNIGYWTSSTLEGSSNDARSVYYVGYTYGDPVNYGSSYGVRPVITISKTAPIY